MIGGVESLIRTWVSQTRAYSLHAHMQKQHTKPGGCGFQKPGAGFHYASCCSTCHFPALTFHSHLSAPAVHFLLPHRDHAQEMPRAIQRQMPVLPAVVWPYWLEVPWWKAGFLVNKAVVERKSSRWNPRGSRKQSFTDLTRVARLIVLHVCWFIDNRRLDPFIDNHRVTIREYFVL